MRIHPHDSLLQETFRRQGGIVSKVLDHLSACQKCQHRLSNLKKTDIVRDFPSKDSYGLSLDRAFQLFEIRQSELEGERTEAPALVDRLLGLTPERRQLLLRNSRRFQAWGVLELLIRQGREETFTDSLHAEEILQIGVEISKQLSSTSYGKERIADLQARTWGYIANARRARMELQAAEETFEEAFSYLSRGTGDFMEQAVLMDLQASLRRIQRRYEESLQLLEKAQGIFRRMGETNRVGKVLVSMSSAYRFNGDPDQAISLLNKALGLINQADEPRLALYALHNLADILASSGRFMRAHRELLRAHRLYQQFPDPRIQSGRMWIEAKVAYGLAHKEAEELLIQAYHRFISVHSPIDRALITQDLEAVRAMAAGTPQRKLPANGITGNPVGAPDRDKSFRKDWHTVS